MTAPLAIPAAAARVALALHEPAPALAAAMVPSRTPSVAVMGLALLWLGCTETLEFVPDGRGPFDEVADDDDIDDAFDLGGAVADARLVGTSGSRAGSSVAGVGDIDGDGYGDLLISAPGDNEGGGADSASAAGAAYLVLGPWTGEVELEDVASAKLLGPPEHVGAGFVVASAGDHDGDGRPELLVTAPDAADGAPEGTCDAVYLVEDQVIGTAAVDEAGVRIVGCDEYGSGVWAATAAGDTDGDGFGDILLGARWDGEAGELAGAALLFAGPLTPASSIDTAAAKLLGAEAGGMAGTSVAAAGDVDDDGNDDVVVGQLQVTIGGTCAFLVRGPMEGTSSLAGAATRFRSAAEADYAGMSVDGGGDADGDGVEDVLIGAPAIYPLDGVGAAYLLSGDLTGDVGLDQATARLAAGTGEYDLFGYDVAFAGDVNGDGFDDVLVGAAYHEGSASRYGAVFLALGPLTGDLALVEDGIVLESPSDEAVLGWSLAGVGDLDADGLDDVAVAAPSETSFHLDTGVTYLLYGDTQLR